MKKMTAGGGWPAIWYTLKKARAAGGLVRMVPRALIAQCVQDCALGMGGQQGGMRNEAGRFPEVCKKVHSGHGRGHARAGAGGVL